MSTTNIEGFQELLTRITNNLGISLEKQEEIIIKFNEKFNGNDKYQIIQSLKENKIDELLRVDTSINNLKISYPDILTNNNRWDSLKDSLGELQALIFIKKLETPKPDCKEIVNTIVSALDNKIKLVNTILEENITTSELRTKYIKYKSKYLHLKNIK